MTFSICVRERYTDDSGADQVRFGVAVTTRLPAVGTLCPFVSEHGAVATQSLVNVDLGRRGLAYLEDGLAIGDALEALLNADKGREGRQVHGIDAERTFAFSGDDCVGWYGHDLGQNFTVAGNMLVGEAVIEETAAAYAADAHGERPLAERLIDALSAGHAVGGDKREDLPVQSAALKVATTEPTPMGEPLYNDLRVDATETPIDDLRATFEAAKRGWEDAMDRYADASEADSIDGAAEPDAEEPVERTDPDR
ncbi:DUF1028 domain-containing protein [Halorubrum vacuolatum]|uniref:Uncharacterized conserved protein, Ntn-hydrolase superfamily n=1 Tax=Halorubrum vacuolatum TaxID=63740 RepID=A0A238VQ43_HALVU|nr:DUF1028 domain-containing protein [Halorubrum vacuolatum]SNR36267.1 Uncharacterized conserved protein, Ntn-hydrolase superfamily [Halorubrum vacuolatum]